MVREMKNGRRCSVSSFFCACIERSNASNEGTGIFSAVLEEGLGARVAMGILFERYT